MMLGRTAGGIYWMFRYLERSENMARLIEAGLRIALTRGGKAIDEWRSLVTTVGMRDLYEAKHGEDFSATRVIDFLLRERDGNNSVVCMLEDARNNGRASRAMITREVWEALNDCYLVVRDALQRPVAQSELPKVLGLIRQHSALVRGALHGTMLRNEVFNFARVGTFAERADNTARILDVKYYVLLPSVSYIGGALDNVQWETILRSLSAQRAYRWLNPGETVPLDIARFLILDRRFPRSLAFCMMKMSENLGYLAQDYGKEHPCHHLLEAMNEQMRSKTIEEIFESGLHEFVVEFLELNRRLAGQIEIDYRFSN
jgi:uncharacterized alpha-E superfamily protein